MELAFSGEESNNANRSYVPFLRLSARGAEYWKKYPLNTARNIREWQHDCVSQEKKSDEPNRIQSEPMHTPANMPAAKQDNQDGTTDGAQDNLGSGYRTTLSHDVSRHETQTVHPEASPPLPLHPHASTSQPGKHKRSTERQSLLLNSPSHQSPTDSDISQQPSLWTGAPSIKFQEQFLW